jgi:hypothetical protein
MVMTMSMPMMMIVLPTHDPDTFQKLFDSALLAATNGHNLASSRVHASLFKAPQPQGGSWQEAEFGDVGEGVSCGGGADWEGCQWHRRTGWRRGG